jgi:hypothetical protein
MSGAFAPCRASIASSLREKWVVCLRSLVNVGIVVPVRMSKNVGVHKR